MGPCAAQGITSDACIAGATVITVGSSPNPIPDLEALLSRGNGYYVSDDLVSRDAGQTTRRELGGDCGVTEKQSPLAKDS